MGSDVGLRFEPCIEKRCRFSHESPANRESAGLPYAILATGLIPMPAAEASTETFT